MFTQRRSLFLHQSNVSFLLKIFVHDMLLAEWRYACYFQSVMARQTYNHAPMHSTIESFKKLNRQALACLLTSPASLFRSYIFQSSALQLREFRGLVLQQASEFFMRMDWHYESFPRKWFTLRLPGGNLRQFCADARDLPSCCKDIGFTRRACDRSAADFDNGFLSVLASIDLDDSISTIVENERQHGRLRVGYGVKLQMLERCLAKAMQEQRK